MFREFSCKPCSCVISVISKKASLTVSNRAEIVGLHEVGLSKREVGKKVHVSKTAVPQAISKFKISGKYTDLKRSGRSRKTTEKGTYVSRNTISRNLMKDFALLSYKATRKSRLTTSMKKKRLTFTQNHKNWTVQLWSTMLFSNKSSVQQFSACATTVRRPVGKRYEERYTSPTVKHVICAIV
jgi:hypothetical protein